MEVLPENVADDQKMAIQVLSDGRDFADQLRRIMLSKGQPLKDSDSDSLGDLVSKILDSFHKSLLILQIPPSLAADETSQVPAGSCDGGTVKSEELDSGQSSKMVKDRRGCYKRRRISEAEIKVSGGQLEDGHAWRKYGQKSILNAKYPRNYYRCTHKFEQGCPATKQVQKTEEDPPMYRTTYYGQHTCRNTSDFNQLLLDSSTTTTTDLTFGDSSSNSFLLNFQNKNIIPPFSPNHYYKQHQSTNSIPSNNNNNYTPSSSTDYLSSPHIGNTFGSSANLPDQLLSPSASDVITGSRVYSCTTSTTTPDHITVFDDQMMAATANFDDDLDSFFV